MEAQGRRDPRWSRQRTHLSAAPASGRGGLNGHYGSCHWAEWEEGLGGLSAQSGLYGAASPRRWRWCAPKVLQGAPDLLAALATIGLPFIAIVALSQQAA